MRWGFPSSTVSTPLCGQRYSSNRRAPGAVPAIRPLEMETRCFIELRVEFSAEITCARRNCPSIGRVGVRTVDPLNRIEAGGGPEAALTVERALRVRFVRVVCTASVVFSVTRPRCLRRRSPFGRKWGNDVIVPVVLCLSITSWRSITDYCLRFCRTFLALDLGGTNLCVNHTFTCVDGADRHQHDTGVFAKWSFLVTTNSC